MMKDAILCEVGSRRYIVIAPFGIANKASLVQFGVCENSLIGTVVHCWHNPSEEDIQALEYLTQHKTRTATKIFSQEWEEDKTECDMLSSTLPNVISATV